MSRDHSQNHYGPNASFDGYDSDLASAGILIESLRQQVTLLREALLVVDAASKNADVLINFGAIRSLLAATEPKP